MTEKQETTPEPSGEQAPPPPASEGISAMGLFMALAAISAHVCKLDELLRDARARLAVLEGKNGE